MYFYSVIYRVLTSDKCSKVDFFLKYCFSREEYCLKEMTHYHTACINTYISLNQFNAIVRLVIRVHLRKQLFSSASRKVDSRGVGASIRLFFFYLSLSLSTTTWHVSLTPGMNITRWTIIISIGLIANAGTGSRVVRTARDDRGIVTPSGWTFALAGIGHRNWIFRRNETKFHPFSHRRVISLGGTMAPVTLSSLSRNEGYLNRDLDLFYGFPTEDIKSIRTLRIFKSGIWSTPDPEILILKISNLIKK